ncbi:hypothetical protein [Thermogemmatispora tikiterensis]|uniref:Uncharacterized protein n=1 Tax=Thermogemmatispora tikiterensis TaxID=1825093 RepID=A0A328VAH3_9CHLR|nr:hypothetical protein [Thermogemmatispora tikiterensis]RAQ94598.1 hypothetical protein A4R35_03565 [Thermogemmatispora tikiterensis]
MKRWVLALSVALTMVVSCWLLLPAHAQAAALAHKPATATRAQLPILRSRFYYNSPDQHYSFGYSFSAVTRSDEYYLDAGTHQWIFTSYNYRPGYAMLLTLYLNDVPIGTAWLPEAGGTVTVTGGAGYYSFQLEKAQDGFYVQGSVQNFWPLIWVSI